MFLLIVGLNKARSRAAGSIPILQTAVESFFIFFITQIQKFSIRAFLKPLKAMDGFQERHGCN
jgi:hypothetical protein